MPKVCKYIRRNGEESVRARIRNPTEPIVGFTVVGSTVLEVPVVARVREVAERVVCSDGVATPARDCDTEVLDVCGIRGEIDTVDEVGDRVSVGVVDAGTIVSGSIFATRDETYLVFCLAGRAKVKLAPPAAMTRLPGARELAKVK